MKITDVSKLKGPLGELHDQLFGDNGEERLAEFNLWLKRVTSVLRRVTTVHVCDIKRFIASAAFGKDNPAGIKFFLGENFKNNFLGKIEENVPATELAVDVLTKPLLDAPIRAELTHQREETFLAYFYELISKQPNGEAGPLLTSGYTNVFYIRDVKNIVWAVHAYWRSGDRGWNVNADSVTDPNEWHAGSQDVSQAG